MRKRVVNLNRTLFIKIKFSKYFAIKLSWLFAVIITPVKCLLALKSENFSPAFALFTDKIYSGFQVCASIF